MKTLIAIPCMENAPNGFQQSLLYLEKGENVSVNFRANSLVYDSRNILSLTAIEQGFDRVMWIDSDMMFTKDAMKILSADMDGRDWKTGDVIDRPRDMVTGIYFKRKPPCIPVLYKELSEPTVDADGKPVGHITDFLDYPRDSFFRVAGCGFGFCMTSTKLLKDVWDHFGPAFSPYPWGGEDISFCHRVNQLGYEIWCDSRVSCGHIGTYVYTEKDFLRMRGDVNGKG